MQTYSHNNSGVLLQAAETWKHIPEQNKHNSNIAAYCSKNNSRSLDNLLEESPGVLGRTRKRRRGSANGAHGNTENVLRRKELVRRRMEEIGSSLFSCFLDLLFFCFFVAFGFAFVCFFFAFILLLFCFYFAFFCFYFACFLLFFGFFFAFY